jgi:hypothetical protein
LLAYKLARLVVPACQFVLVCQLFWHDGMVAGPDPIHPLKNKNDDLQTIKQSKHNRHS